MAFLFKINIYVYRWLLLLSLFISISSNIVLGASKKPVTISGGSFFENRHLHRLLEILDTSSGETALFSINTYYIEDALALCNQEIKRSGFEKPCFTVYVLDRLGNEHVFTYQNRFIPELPLSIDATSLHIDIQKGPLTYYNRICVRGVPILNNKDLEAFFYKNKALYITESERSFTHQNLKTSTHNLLKLLREKGYVEVKHADPILTKNNENEGLDVYLDIDLGPCYYVSEFQVIDCDVQPTPEVFVQLNISDEHQAYTEQWKSMYLDLIRKELFQKGYPNVEIKTKVLQDHRSTNAVYVKIIFEVYPHKQVHVGSIEWKGIEGIKQSILEFSEALKPNDILDPERLEQQQMRLLDLGLFEDVDVYLEHETSELYNIHYKLRKKKKLTVDGLIGWGSYDRLRIGALFNRNNVFGLGHRDDLELIYSIKAIEGTYAYRIPNLLNYQGVNGFIRSNALNRKELSFVRNEKSLSLGLDSLIKTYNIGYSISFDYEFLHAISKEQLNPISKPKARVSAINLELFKSKLDNTIFPQRGYKFLTNFKCALPALGGNTAFEKIEGRLSMHMPLGELQILHTQVRHGAIFTPQTSQKDLAFNERFFLGGQTCMRGFREGEASSRSSDGTIIGSESYLTTSIDIEQKILNKVSIFGFIDAAVIAKHIRSYPGDQKLCSIGLGIMFATVIGPIRLEYGHNIKRRPQDPKGTFHLSVGYPF